MVTALRPLHRDAGHISHFSITGQRLQHPFDYLLGGEAGGINLMGNRAVGSAPFTQ